MFDFCPLFLPNVMLFRLCLFAFLLVARFGMAQDDSESSWPFGSSSQRRVCWNILFHFLLLCMVYSNPQSCTSSNSECSGFPSTPVCDTVSQTCKACSSGADCHEGKHCSYSGANSGACVECTDNYHCKVDTPICSIGNTCTVCSSGGDCPSGTLGDGEIAAVVICSLIGAGAIIAFFLRGGFSSMSFGGLRCCESLAPVGLRGDARLAPVKVVPTNGISSLNMPVPAYIVRAKLDTRHSSSNIVSV